MKIFIFSVYSESCLSIGESWDSAPMWMVVGMTYVDK